MAGRRQVSGCPARALEQSTCWRVAQERQSAVTWYETEDRARRAYERALESGEAAWLVSPRGDMVVEHAPAICDRCISLGYPPDECHVRLPLDRVKRNWQGRFMDSINATRIVSNARRLGHSAFTTSIALDIVAPVAGHSWYALCCHCAAAADPLETLPAHRVATESHQDAGGCSRCPYSGCDTLVIALPVVR